MRRRLLGFLVLPALVIAVLFLPLSPRGLGSHPHPTHNYAEALDSIAAFTRADGPRVAPECRTALYTHGRSVAHAIVMFHGLTNCPAQFDSLARIAYERGANVFVPRLPRHGMADRMTKELGRSDAHELVRFTDRAIDAAHGLGDSVTVVGLSVGGTLAAWAAQERTDVRRAILIAPMIGVAKAPGVFTPVVARMTALFPNLFVWWNPKEKQALAGPRHVYPRFASRSVAATLMVGGETMQAARRAPPGARSVAFVTVEGDPAVDNGAIAELARMWQHASVPVVVERSQFPKALKLNHDIVDPAQVGANPNVTYPVLTRLIGP
jgi:alpha-beta hydrolase superfamily lysophospholipase